MLPSFKKNCISQFPISSIVYEKTQHPFHKLNFTHQIQFVETVLNFYFVIHCISNLNGLGNQNKHEIYLIQDNNYKNVKWGEVWLEPLGKPYENVIQKNAYWFNNTFEYDPSITTHLYLYCIFTITIIYYNYWLPFIATLPTAIYLFTCIFPSPTILWNNTNWYHTHTLSGRWFTLPTETGMGALKNASERKWHLMLALENQSKLPA